MVDCHEPGAAYFVNFCGFLLFIHMCTFARATKEGRILWRNKNTGLASYDRMIKCRTDSVFNPEKWFNLGMIPSFQQFPGQMQAQSMIASGDHCVFHSLVPLFCIYFFPAAQRIAFLNSFWNSGFVQTARVCPGVSAATRPRPKRRR